MGIMDKAAAIIGSILLAVLVAVPLTILVAIVIVGLKEVFKKEK